MNNISIIIPTYKEKDNIFKLTRMILSILPKATIYVIDDTKNLNLKKYFKNKRIKYFQRKNKKGRGSAVLYGLNKSLQKKKNKIFIEMDADFSHNPNELKKKINFFLKKNLDLLISSRYLKKSKIVNWPISRLLFSKLSNLLARILLKVGVTDYTNGYRVYSRKSVELIVRKCGKIGDGFIVLSEILLTIKLKKYKIDEMPSIFINRKRGESSINLKLIIQSLFGIIKLYFIRINNS